MLKITKTLLPIYAKIIDKVEREKQMNVSIEVEKKITIKCEYCENKITPEDPGVIVVGNIYVAEPNEEHCSFEEQVGANSFNSKMIVGDNIPHWTDEGQPKTDSTNIGRVFKFARREMRTKAYHRRCIKTMIDKEF